MFTPFKFTSAFLTYHIPGLNNQFITEWELIEQLKPHKFSKSFILTTKLVGIVFINRGRLKLLNH